jgi:hypothetical protein
MCEHDECTCGQCHSTITPPTPATLTGTYNAGNLVLVLNGGSIVIPIPTGGIQTLSLVGDNINISGGNTIDLGPLLHPAVIATQSASPYSFNAATQTFNFPNTPSLTNNGNGTITYVKGDGTAPLTISLGDDLINAPLTINGLLYPTGTSYESILRGLNLEFVSREIVGTIGATTIIIPAIPAITKFGQFFRNGLRKNSTEYIRVGNTFSFSVPVGASGGALQGETFIIDYWTLT